MKLAKSVFCDMNICNLRNKNPSAYLVKISTSRGLNRFHEKNKTSMLSSKAEISNTLRNNIFGPESVQGKEFSLTLKLCFNCHSRALPMLSSQEIMQICHSKKVKNNYLSLYLTYNARSKSCLRLKMTNLQNKTFFLQAN